MQELQKALTRAEKAQKLIDHFGYNEYCKIAFERFSFPFIWGISQCGEILIDNNCILDYLRSEMGKGLSGDEIIERDKMIQDEAMNKLYDELSYKFIK